MKLSTLRRLAAVLIALTIPAAAQVKVGYTQVSAANVTDSSGVPLVNGTISFAPVNNAGQPISYQINGSGQSLYTPVTTLVTSGAFQILLADTTLTIPVNVCFLVTITDNVSGKSVLGPGYTCFQPAGYGSAVTSGMCTAASSSAGGTCSFDKFQPNLPGLVVQQTGPTGPTGATGPMGPQGPPTSIIGLWSSTQAYVNGNTVSYNGNMYMALQSSTNQTPPATCTSNTYWQNVACNVGVPGLTSDSANGTITQGNQQIGTLQKTFSCGGTNTDATSVAGWLSTAGAGAVAEARGNCVSNGTTPLVLSSGQTLRGGVWTITSGSVPSPATSGWIMNKASQAAPQRSFTDGAPTQGSTTFTSATAAFVAADMGQTIMCNGAFTTAPTQQGNAIPTTFWTSIAYITNATTITTADPWPNTLTGLSCSIYYRDSHIRLQNMTIINNGPTCNTVGSGGTWWATYFLEVNDLELDDVQFQDGATGQSTYNGCKSLLIGAATSVRTNNLFMRTWTVLQDGVDWEGPITDVVDTNRGGQTGDDMNSIDPTMAGYTQGNLPGFPQGPASNFTFIGGNFAAQYSMVKLTSASGTNYLPVKNVHIIGMHGRMTGSQGTSSTGIYQGLNLTEGLSDNLVLDGLSGNVQAALVAGNATANHVTLKNISTISNNSVTTLVNISSSTFGDVVIDGLAWNGPLAGSRVFNSDGKSTFNSLTLRNFSTTNLPVGTTIYTLSVASIGTLNIEDCSHTMTAGSNGVLYWFGPANGQTTTWTLNTLNIVNCTMYIASGTNGPYPGWFQLYQVANNPTINVVNTSLISATAGTYGQLLGVSGVSNSQPFVNFVNNTLANVRGCGLGSGSGAQITGYGNIYSGLSIPTQCPPNGNAFATPTLNGPSTLNGITTAYDNVALAQLVVPTIGSIGTATTGGTLPDATAYYYKVCVQNSNGYACTSERPITTGNSGANTNSVTVPSISVVNTLTYVLGRSTTSGAEQVCTTPLLLTPFYVFNSLGGSIKDTGFTCTGATLPTTNTTAPSLIPAAPRKGTFVCTAAGTITITNTFVSATSDVTITLKTAGGTITTPPAVKTITAGSGFSVLCGASDTSTYTYTVWN